MDREAWWATVHGVAKSWDFTFTFFHFLWQWFKGRLADKIRVCAGLQSLKLV